MVRRWESEQKVDVGYDIFPADCLLKLQDAETLHVGPRTWLTMVITSHWTKQLSPSNNYNLSR
jgi:hypothetical protein